MVVRKSLCILYILLVLFLCVEPAFSQDIMDGQGTVPLPSPDQIVLVYAGYEWAAADVQVLQTILTRQGFTVHKVDVQTLPASQKLWASTVRNTIPPRIEEGQIVVLGMGVAAGAAVDASADERIDALVTISAPAESQKRIELLKLRSRYRANGTAESVVVAMEPYWAVRMEYAALRAQFGIPVSADTRVPLDILHSAGPSWERVQVPTLAVYGPLRAYLDVDQTILSVDKRLQSSSSPYWAIHYFEKQEGRMGAYGAFVGKWLHATASNAPLPEEGKIDVRVLTAEQNALHWTERVRMNSIVVVALTLISVVGAFYGMFRCAQEIQEEGRSYILDVVWYGTLIALGALVGGILTDLLPMPATGWLLLISTGVWFWTIAGLVRFRYRIEGIVSGTIHLSWFVVTVSVLYIFGMYAIGWY